jgi:hypothetical protein
MEIHFRTFGSAGGLNAPAVVCLPARYERTISPPMLWLTISISGAFRLRIVALRRVAKILNRGTAGKRTRGKKRDLDAFRLKPRLQITKVVIGGRILASAGKLLAINQNDRRPLAYCDETCE